MNEWRQSHVIITSCYGTIATFQHKRMWSSVRSCHCFCQVAQMIQLDLTLSQRTYSRLFQIQRVCRRQFHVWWKWHKVLKMGRKHCGKRRNCSLRAFSSFPTVFSKDFACRHVKTRACLGKGQFCYKQDNTVDFCYFMCRWFIAVWVRRLSQGTETCDDNAIFHYADGGRHVQIECAFFFSYFPEEFYGSMDTFIV